MKTLDLNDLDAVRSVTIGDATFPVKAITPRALFLIDAADQAEGVEKIRRYVDAVCALVPSMSREQVEELTMRNLLDVIALASQQVDAVEAAAPKATRPSGRRGRART